MVHDKYEGLAEAHCRRFEGLKGSRGALEAHLEDIARQVAPSFAGAFGGGFGNQASTERRSEYMFDSTAPIALTRFSAAMESMLTPRNQKWHRLIAQDSVLKRNRATQVWMEDATNILFRRRYAPKANFASQIHEVYTALGAFGTDLLFTDSDPKDRGLRYRAVHLPEAYLANNHQGMVDTVYRYLSGMTARSVLQKFPDAALEKARAAVAAGHPDEPVEIIHCVYPRGEAEGYAPDRLDGAGLPFASVYVDLGTKEVLSVGGYSSFPYAVSRYVTILGETYGRSPAMDALPAIKTINEQKKDYLRTGQRIANPTYLAADDGILDTFSARPGAIVAGGVSADGKQLVHTLPAGNIIQAKDMMELEKATINDAFLVTLFQILVETPRMTATEVLERAREKGALLSPTMGRQQSELLGPLVEREMNILAENGQLPPMPAILQEAAGEYDISYDSPLSRAQRAEEGAGALRTVQWATEIAANSQDPSALDWFDIDTMIPELADINAMPARWLMAPEAVAAKRQARAQAQQAAQLMEAAPGLAGAAKDLAGAARPQ